MWEHRSVDMVCTRDQTNKYVGNWIKEKAAQSKLLQIRNKRVWDGQVFNVFLSEKQIDGDIDEVW